MTETNKTNANDEIGKTTTKTNTSKSKQAPKRTTRKKIDKDTEVLVMNNTSGIFVYVCPKTRNEYTLSEFGDTVYMTIEELKVMSNQHKGILTKYWIVPIEVLDDNISIDEVIQYINMENYYTDDVFTDDGEFDKFIVKSTSEEFTKAFNEMSDRYKLIVAERTVALYKKRQVNDFGKTRFIEEVLDKPNLFADAEMQINGKK